MGNSKWGAHPATIRSTALALCYTSAEYACPVWERSAHAHKINPVLDRSCRYIAGCLMPKNVNSFYILSSIAPPDIRRSVASRKESTRQQENRKHVMFNQEPARSRLKSRKSFLATFEPLSQSSASTRLQMWQERLATESTNIELPVKEVLPPGSDAPWKEWRCLNRLRSGKGRCRALMHRWGFSTNNEGCS